MNLDPGQCLILEDNKNGIKAAVDSGAYVLTVGDVWDVNYENIIGRIGEIERGERQ